MNYVESYDELTIDQYPIGGGNRGAAIYSIETKGKKQRFSRITEKRNGGFGAPKKTTYGEKCKILLADDGKTYLATYSSGFFSILQSNMKFDAEMVFSGDEKFESLKTLFGM